MHDNYIVAVTASRTLWHFESVPISIELDAMAGGRFGDDSMVEVGITPVVRWRDFPWNDFIYTNLRFGPVGLSYLSEPSDLEKTSKGSAQLQNLLVIEVTAADPDDTSTEFFFRHHHRCDLFDTMNSHGGNGTDFLTRGMRKRFQPRRDR